MKTLLNVDVKVYKNGTIACEDKLTEEEKEIVKHDVKLGIIDQIHRSKYIIKENQKKVIELSKEIKTMKKKSTPRVSPFFNSVIDELNDEKNFLFSVIDELNDRIKNWEKFLFSPICVSKTEENKDV